MNNNLIAVISLIISIYIQQCLGINNVKECYFNDASINSKVFHNNACWKCYENYAERNRLQKLSCHVQHDGLDFTVPGFYLQSQCVLFDHRSAPISELVQSSLSNKTYAMWIKCCQDAVRCCDNMIETVTGENFFNTCDAHWDGMNCFNETEPGVQVKMPCPYQLRRLDDSKCEYSYFKTCDSNGTWTKSDFSQCHQTERSRNFIKCHVGIIAITLTFCLPPILSIMFCKSCHGKHLKTLIGLIIFVTLRSILKLTLVSMMYTDTMTLTVNSLTCKTLVAMIHFTTSMCYACLSLVALKLLQIVRNSKSGSWGMFMMMSITLLFSILSTIVWSFAMKIFSNKLCWTDDNGFSWIYQGVRVVILLITILFLLLCLCHRSEQYDEQVMFFTKATSFSVALFIFPILFAMFSSICGWIDTSKFINEFLEFIQVISIAFLVFIPLSKTPLKSNKSMETAPGDSSANLTRNLDAFSVPIAEVGHSNFAVSSDYEIYSEIGVNYSPEPTIYQKRRPIRQIMQNTKRNSPRVDRVKLRKVSVPPIPKVIPNQILDDVQLFDAYYRSLDSQSNSNIYVNSNDGHKRMSIKNLGRVFSSSSNQHKTLNSETQIYSNTAILDI